MYLPPEWPPEVRPPSVPEWETSAVAWLLDCVPPDYRAHEVLPRKIALTRLATHHVEHALQETSVGFRDAAVDLRDHLPPHTIEAVLTTYRQERARLTDLAHMIKNVEGALTVARR